MVGMATVPCGAAGGPAGAAAGAAGLAAPTDVAAEIAAAGAAAGEAATTAAMQEGEGLDADGEGEGAAAGSEAGARDGTAAASTSAGAAEVAAAAAGPCGGAETLSVRARRRQRHRQYQQQQQQGGAGTVEPLRHKGRRQAEQAGQAAAAADAAVDGTRPTEAVPDIGSGPASAAAGPHHHPHHQPHPQPQPLPLPAGWTPSSQGPVPPRTGLYVGLARAVMGRQVGARAGPGGMGGTRVYTCVPPARYPGFLTAMHPTLPTSHHRTPRPHVCLFPTQPTPTARHTSPPRFSTHPCNPPPPSCQEMFRAREGLALELVQPVFRVPPAVSECRARGAGAGRFCHYRMVPGSVRNLVRVE